MIAKTSQPIQSAPGQWVDLHGNYLYRFALSRLRKPELAENAVQETFLAALNARKRFSGLSTERTWLIGILKHKIYDHFRHTHREIAVTDLQTDDEQTIDSFYDFVGRPKNLPADWTPNPRELSKNKEFWRVFEDCLKKVPEKTANAFMMREIDKLRSKEICKHLHISSTNLWVMLHRARLQLRACLEANWFRE